MVAVLVDALNYSFCYLLHLLWRSFGRALASLGRRLLIFQILQARIKSGCSLKALFHSVVLRIKAADCVSLLTIAFFIVFGSSTIAFVIGFINAVVYFLLVIITSIFTACLSIRKRIAALPLLYYSWFRLILKAS